MDSTPLQTDWFTDQSDTDYQSLNALLDPEFLSLDSEQPPAIPLDTIPEIDLDHELQALFSEMPSAPSEAMQSERANSGSQDDTQGAFTRIQHCPIEGVESSNLNPEVLQILTNLVISVNTLQQSIPALCNKLDDILSIGKEVRQIASGMQKGTDSMDKNLVNVQRYVNSLVPWSMAVHEKYTKLSEIVEVQAKSNANKG